MASQLLERFEHPIPPPPPAYLRSPSPPGPREAPPSQRLPSDDSHHRNLSKEKINVIPKRKPVSLPPVNVNDDNPVIHDSPVSPVKIDDPSGIRPAWTAQIEDADQRGTHHQVQVTKGEANLESSPQNTSSSQRYAPYRPPNSEISGSGSATNTPQRRDSITYDTYRGASDGASHGKARNGSSSRGSLDSVPQQEGEEHEPLQYHHQPFRPRPVDRNGKRGSKSTLVSNSDSSSSGDPTYAQNHLAPARRNHGNLSVPRPNSAYSSTSELAARGRTRSPQLSPHLNNREVSSHSNVSADARPLSFVDLLNVPYPQPPPAPATLSNAHLRGSIGKNASLLSHKQTFEMYLANVKKTNDAGAQYEFAVFMIHATQEQSGDPSRGPQSNKASDITKEELLREAKAILSRLADRSYPYAQYYLADGYASGLFSKGKPDHDKAFGLFVAASKHGHAEAGYRAALCYEFGWGSRKDGAKAVQFYRQAASKNHPGAMSRLGKACLAGDMGQVKRYREGITWLKRAAESADLQYNSAPFELAVLHETGYGDDVFQDESYAAQLFTKSAELGHAEANYRLGDAYEHGRLNCPRDPALSVHFYTSAAQLAHPMAMMALCAWYMVGADPVLEKDEYEAYEWAKRAANTGKFRNIATNQRNFYYCMFPHLHLLLG